MRNANGIIVDDFRAEKKEKNSRKSGANPSEYATIGILGVRKKEERSPDNREMLQIYAK